MEHDSASPVFALSAILALAGLAAHLEAVILLILNSSTSEQTSLKDSEYIEPPDLGSQRSSLWTPPRIGKCEALLEAINDI
jgi:hypothetical protein